jgi:hypothetical protein
MGLFIWLFIDNLLRNERCIGLGCQYSKAHAESGPLKTCWKNERLGCVSKVGHVDRMMRGEKMAVACANLIRITASGTGLRVFDRMGR